MQDLKRTHTCGELRGKNDGEKVVLKGWVSAKRNLGGLLFVSLRDRYGFTQIVFDPNSEAYNTIDAVGVESVVEIEGKARLRPSDQIKKDDSTGEIEVLAESAKVLNSAVTPPFEIKEHVEVSEELRLKYRYLDLRRRPLMQALELRSKASLSIRNYFNSKNFLEVETPVLTKSTPEGARDFLVPSRVHKGKFYALPQSPQLFKQLLMVAGYDRYFQIVKCYRDEDLRADRQPEFTQIDVEMSFPTPDDIYSLIEGMFIKLFKDTMNVDLKGGFEKVKFSDAMSMYGSDKPERRIPWKMVDLADIFSKSGFGAFSEIANANGAIKGLNVGKVERSRKQLSDLEEGVKGFGAKGMVWIKVEGKDFKSPIAKFISEDEKVKLIERLSISDGDLVLIVGDKKRKVAESSLGDVRLKLGREVCKIDPNTWDFHWIVDVPLFEWSEEEKKFLSTHHPFTSPVAEDIDKLKKSPEGVISQGYDIVLNGYELGSGSIRIHDEAVQKLIFKHLGLSDDEAKAKFGFLMEAFRYGAPPHGGIALGLDRIVMLMAGLTSIRDVIAFPKTTSATCLMTDAPSEASKFQLDDLHLKVK